MVPFARSLTNLAFCFAVSLGVRPGGGLAFCASGPPGCNGFRQRRTELWRHPIRRAISWRESFYFKKATPRRRRCSGVLG